MVYKKKAIAVDDPKKPKTEEQSVGLWHERISIAKKEQDVWVDESGAKRFCEEYKGKFDLCFQGRTKKIPVPPINEVFSYVQSDLASTYNRDPYITVNAKSGTTLGAKLWEIWLNYEWRELNTKEEIEFEIIDKDLVGYAMHKVGHTVDSVGTGEQLKILRQALYSMRVDWRDILWNIGARRPPYDCQWMAQRIVRPLEDIKDKYPNARDMKGTCHPDLDKETYQKTQYKDDIEVGIYYEIWDARSRQIYLIAEGLKGKFLEDPRPWPPYLDEFPFLMYWDFAVPGSPRPLSAIAPWEAQILEKMVLMAQAVLHAKRWNRQAFVKQGAIDENALDKYERGDDGAIIVVNGIGPLSESIHFVDYGSFPQDFYQIMDRLSAIERDTHGQPEFDRGGVTKTNSRTAGELQLIKSGAKSRTDRKIDRLETHCENIARQMMAHLKGNFDFEKAVKVIGGTPEDVIAAVGEHYDKVTGTIKFSEDEIQGEYDVEVKSGSTLPLDKETKMQILETVLNTLGAVGPNGASPLLQATITEYIDGFGIKPLSEANQKELEALEEQARVAAQEGDANEAKARSQAAKNVASADKIGAEADALRIQPPFVPGSDEEKEPAVAR